MERISDDEQVAGNESACPAEHGDYDPRFAPQRDDPFSYYRWARRERPVHFVDSVNAWMVSRYDDVQTVLNDPIRFSSRIAVPTPADNSSEKVTQILREGLRQGRVIINEDPPRHAEMRRIVSSTLSRRISTSRAHFHEISDELIDGFIADGHAELVWSFCDPLAWRAVQTVVGIPRADQRRTRDWNDDMMTLSLPFPSEDERCVAASGFVAYQRYIADLADERRVDPRDDVISDLVRIDDLPGTPLPVEDLVSLVWSLCTGKNSLRDAIGTCMLTLLSERHHWERARATPEVIPLMLDETLRRDAPLRGLFRETTEKVELGGVSLPKGARLYVMFASANRDDTQFADPDVFDPDRDHLRAHLGFGEGSHRCLGAPISRTVGNIAIAALIKRIPEMRLADNPTPPHLDKYFFHGLRQLEVSW